MINGLVVRLYWPALLSAWACVVVAVGAGFDMLPARLTDAVAWGSGALLALLFLLAVFDPCTQAAVLDYGTKKSAGWKATPWKQMLFSSDLGDRQLLVVNRVAWLAMVAFILTGSETAQVLTFISFGLSASWLLLNIKNAPSPPSTAEPPTSER